MLSSFACAVPGIMATRVIPDRRDRLATILAAPFMTCSARLPVYALLIGAFVPDRHFLGGIVNLQGLILLALYMLGILGGVLTALLLKRTVLRGPTPTFMIELPPYRLPSWRSLLLKLMERGRVFLVRAGTVIFSVAILIWALAYFPRPAEIGGSFAAEREAIEASALSMAERDERLAALDAAEIERLPGAELARPPRPLRCPRLRAAGLGLEALGRRHRQFPGPRDRRRLARHHLLGRRPGRQPGRRAARTAADGHAAGRHAGLHGADGHRPADLLRLLPAVRRHHRGHAA